MFAPSHQTLGDYCRRTESDDIYLGFRPANLITFDMKNHVLTSLKEETFDGKESRGPWEHLAKVYETCSMCKPAGDITDDQVNLCLFSFSLIGCANDWL